MRGPKEESDRIRVTGAIPNFSFPETAVLHWPQSATVSTVLATSEGQAL